MERILVAVDFSPVSRGAMKAALQLGKAWGGQIEIVHVVPTFVQAYEMGPAWRLDPEMLKKELDDFVGEVVGDELSKVGRHILEGPSVKEILAAAERLGATLIVVGSHGRSMVGRFLLGSVSGGVVQRASTPVLVVRNEAAGLPARVLAAVELDGSAEAVLRSAVAWSQMLGSKVDVVHVWDDIPEPILARFHPESAVLAEMLARRDKARHGVMALLDRVVEGEVAPRVVFLDGSPELKICEEVEAGGYELVILGTHERHDWLDWGNTTVGVVHHCPASILVVRPLKA